MKTSLLVTTYNWEAALTLVLESVQRQSQMPDELLIADDGSGFQTKEIIDSFKKIIDCPVRHIWHEDDGFRASVIRNKTIAAAQGDYIITIDGDMILHRHFVKDHISVAREGYFIQGRRIRLSQGLTGNVLAGGKIDFSFFTPGILRRQQHIRSKLLSNLFSNSDQSFRHVRGCNMAFWKKDIIGINGYNEDMIGWGYEDWELCSRFYNHKLNRYYLRFYAIAYHLEHGERPRDRKSINREIFEATKASQMIKTSNGISKYS